MTDQPSNNPMISPAQRPSWLRERAAGAQRLARRSFTLESLVSGIKTLAWVAPLTILIWIYAEREQIVPKDANIPIAVRSPDPSLYVRLQGDHTVLATLSGPNAAVQQAADVAQRAGDEPAVQIDISRQLSPGQWHTIDTAQYLNSNSIFTSRGVTVHDCKPQGLQVFVDEIVEREVDVRAPRNVTNLAAPPIFEPRTVKVRGPRTVLEEVKQTLTVEADLAGREELRSPGPHDIAAVPLHLSTDDPSITVVPTTVHATIDVSQSDERLTIGSMPIWISGPPGPPSLLEKYKVDYNPVLTNITLIGPPEKIELLRTKPELQPIATLYVRREDIGKPKEDRRVKLDLPEGVYVAKEDEARLHVSFKLVELTPSE